MKITPKQSSPDSDLPPKNNSRSKNPRYRLKKNRAPVSRRSRPETPLLKWKIEGSNKIRDVTVDHDDDKSESENCRRDCRKMRMERDVAVGSARKLAAALWRLQLPETVRNGDDGVRDGGQWGEDRLGFEPGVSNVMIPFLCNHEAKSRWCESKDVLHSPGPLSSMANGFFSKTIKSAMEGATKWDPVCLKTTDEIHRIHSGIKLLHQQRSTVAVVSSLEAELEQARARIQELETDRRSFKKKLEHFLRKASEEKVAWRSREHDKIRTFVEDIKAELNREKKIRQRIEFLNSKLVKEHADARLLAKQYMNDYDKERKARMLIEEVCDELAKEIGEDKAEIEALKRESTKLQEEVDDERKMLQMAEVWREERVQMKLIDAKVALEGKYSQMNKIVADLGDFVRERNGSLDVNERREAELLRQAAASVDIQEINEFCYKPPNPDDIFSVFEEVNRREPNSKEIEPCAAYTPPSNASKVRTVSPEFSMLNKDNIQRCANAFVGQNDIEDDESGWETVSHLDDQGSSYSPEGSTLSINKLQQDSNLSGSETDQEDYAGEGTPNTEISEVCSVPKRQLKKVSSIARLWKSHPNNGKKSKIISQEGMDESKLSNGRLSDASILSSERGSSKCELSPSNIIGRWGISDSRNPRINQAMKGLLEWPRGQKNSLKAKLLEARMENQKAQLRHVLKQKA